MQHLNIYKPFAAALVALFVLASSAGVPVRWIAETSRVHPEIIEAWRGDTLDLSCTLRSYGQPVTIGAATASFLWQTNGMGNAWWQTNATVAAGGLITATWAPTMNPGAGEVAFFMPVVCGDGSSYRAAGRIRFRPSPGAGSQTVDLPAPGATLDFGAYTLVNAPWATLEAVNSAIDANNAIIDSAITSATGALTIPPAVDLGPYATTGMVAAAVQASGNALAGQISAVSNAAMQRAEMGDYATHEWTALYVATNLTPPDLSAYATRTYADSVASNAQATAIAAIPSLAGYATQAWAANYFSTNYTPPDLSSYASRSYVDDAAANAQATAMAAIPSLAGYATETYAQSAAEAAASDALNAAQSYARDLSWATAQGNTRLVSSDGMIWQDATGTVWQVTAVYGWSGTVVDIATTVARPIVFAYYGTTTNAPNMSGAETDYWSAGGGTNLYFDAAMASSWELWFVNGYNGYGPNSVFQADGDPTPPITATNLTFTTQVELYSLAYRPVALATNPVDRVLYASGGGGDSYNALTDKPQINGVTLGGTNNTAVGLGLLGTSGGIVNGLLKSSEPLGQSWTGLGVNGTVGYYGGIRWGVRTGTGDNVDFSVLLNKNGGEIVIPSAVGTLALLSDIPDVSDKVSSTALAGKVFDFSTNAGLYLAVSNLIIVLVGSVTNFPAIPQGGN